MFARILYVCSLPGKNGIADWLIKNQIKSNQLHTHTSKAYGSHAKHSYCCPVNQHWDACAPLRDSSFVQANPPGAGLVVTNEITT